MKYLRLMRIKHYIKNLLFVFVPLVFSMSFTNIELVMKSIFAFVAFSLAASIVYIINDLADIEKDRMHPKKCKRPLASGEVSKKEAYVLIVVLAIIISFICIKFLNKNTAIVIMLYCLMNLAYSFKLKNVALIDVLILALGFIFRVYAGAFAINVEVSEWLLLTTFAISLFLGFGKRYGEKHKVTDGDTRKVLEQYDTEVLKMFMVVTMTLTIVFYSLYTILGNSLLKNAIYTIPFVVIGMFRYYMLLEKNINDGDPTEVILNDRIIQIIVLLYVLLVFMLIVF